MSWSPADDPSCNRCEDTDAIELLIDARPRDIGGFTVGRVLPSVRRRTVGPFVFFDHMGPASIPRGRGIDVRPHPHINLATVTYLFAGEIDHRDSLGVHQTIRPGELNLMIAGEGIVHSERSGPRFRETGGNIHGIQLWLALPVEHEETEPAFEHHPEDALPRLERGGVRVQLLLGEAFGLRSPARTFSPQVYAELEMPAGTSLALPAEHHDRATYVVDGELRCGPKHIPARRMAIFAPGGAPVLHAESDARVMLLGGEPFAEKRHMFWNFVSSRPERIERAKQDWEHQRFPLVPGDEDDRVPLPR